MEKLPAETSALFEQARQYELKGDAYNAVKLYKRAARKSPEWAAPLARLGHIYTNRKEWKPALHYNKKTVALQPSDQDAWWRIGLSATALNKKRLANSIWQKFGWSSDRKEKGPIALQLHFEGLFEIVWALPLCPAKASILNIPHPSSGIGFMDIVLYDRQNIVGYNIKDSRRYPVFAEIELFKSAYYQTFSCLLHQPDKATLALLKNLCRNAGLGFEIWSNASKAMKISPRQKIPEFYPANWSQEHGAGDIIVALAARNEADAKKVLRDWAVISLKQYSEWECHT